MVVVKKVSKHGDKLYLGHDDELVAKNFAAGKQNEPTVFLPSHDVVAYHEDFLGDTGNVDFFAFVETDTGTDGITGVITSATNGVFRITSLGGIGSRALAPTANGGLTGGLMKQWKPNSGGPKNSRLRMGARVKLSSISRTAPRIHAFVGFSDSGGSEHPASDTGAGIISRAADLMGFLFSPGGDTGWSLISAKSTAGDSGDQLVVAGSSYAPTANVYQTLEMDYRTGPSDTGGRVHFWIDGQKVGSIDSPVASSTALTPWVGIFCQDTDTGVLDCDYINIAAARDTGE